MKKAVSVGTFTDTEILFLYLQRAEPEFAHSTVWLPSMNTCHSNKMPFLDHHTWPIFVAETDLSEKVSPYAISLSSWSVRNVFWTSLSIKWGWILLVGHLEAHGEFLPLVILKCVTATAGRWQPEVRVSGGGIQRRLGLPRAELLLCHGALCYFWLWHHIKGCADFLCWFLLHTLSPFHTTSTVPSAWFWLTVFYRGIDLVMIRVARAPF